MAKSPETEHPNKVFGWGARDKSGVLSPFHFSRRFPYFSSLLLVSLPPFSFPVYVKEI